MRAHNPTTAGVEPHARGFPPVSQPDAALLVLGSLPGRRSIAAGQYYAQPQNAFWKIMNAICGAGPQLPYAARLERLLGSGIALWDVVESASREGSLDSSIEPASVVVNDIASFLSRHAGIRLICFNGKAASRLYRKHVLPGLSGAQKEIASLELPSTSPAYASMRFEEKCLRWAQAVGSLGR